MQLKSIFSILFLLSFSFSLIHAQSPYQTNKEKSLIFYSTGFSNFFLSRDIAATVEIIPAQEVLTRSNTEVNRFDRIATTYNSEKARNISDIFLYSSILLPTTLLASEDIRSDFGTISTMWGEVMLLNVGFSSYTKKIFLRSRPLVYNQDFELDTKTTKNARYSFFSGHTSTVAANTFFVAQVFSDYYPDSKWKPVVWGLAATAPAITGYLRVRGGKHYPSDVLTGYAVGALIGIMVPTVHKKLSRIKKNKNVTVSVMPTGGYFSVRF